MKTVSELRQGFTQATRIVHITRGALRRVRPHVLDRVAGDHVETLMEQNEAFRRMAEAEHTRVFNVVHREHTISRRRAAGVALFTLHSVEKHIEEGRAWVQATRRDVRLSSPDALTGVTPDGTIMLSLLRLQMTPLLAKASPAELFTIYGEALARKDARALVEAELIEQLAAQGGLATNTDDLDIVKRLRNYIDGAQELRVPLDLPDFEDLAADVSRLQSRAAAAQIPPLNPERDFDAAAAFKEQEAELLEAGTASDRDDMAAVRQELAEAAGQ